MFNCSSSCAKGVIIAACSTAIPSPPSARLHLIRCQKRRSCNHSSLRYPLLGHMPCSISQPLTPRSLQSLALRQPSCCALLWIAAHPAIAADTGLVLCNNVSLANATLSDSCSCKASAWRHYGSCLGTANYTNLQNGSCSAAGCPPGQRVYRALPHPAFNCTFALIGFNVSTAEMYETTCQGRLRLTILSNFTYFFFCYLENNFSCLLRWCLEKLFFGSDFLHDVIDCSS